MINIKHYGDITKINGAEVEPVDVITGGSPCQDLSVAGKRAGLAGARSGLFMEQIRIIKEMRQHDIASGRTNESVRPRYMVWENVAGAFSSNNGEDFRAVLEETAKVAQADAVIPRLPDGVKWSSSGFIMGAGGWSIAWRLHDAQWWGVPQRRKRICMVADFNGDTAPTLLFNPRHGGETEYSKAFETVTDTRAESEPEIQPLGERLPRNTSESGTQGEATSGAAADSARSAMSFQERAGKPGGVRESSFKETEPGPSQRSTIKASSTSADICLNSWDVQSKHIQPQSGIAEALYSGERRYGGGKSYVMQEEAGAEQTVYGMASFESNAMKSANPHSGIYKAQTARTLDVNGGSPACNQGGMIVLEGNGQRESHFGDGYRESETMYTLNTVEQHAVLAPTEEMQEAAADEEEMETYQEVAGTLSPGAHAGSYNGQDAYNGMLVTIGGGDEPEEPTVASKASFFLKGRNDGTADTLVATDYKDPQIVAYGLDRASFNQGRNAKFDFSVDEELAQPIIARGPGGGGNADTVGALCARDAKGVGNQYVFEGKLIIMQDE